MTKIIASFCDCAGVHKPNCVLGKRLKIKYHPLIQKVWDNLGAEFTEELIDFIMGASSNLERTAGLQPAD